MSRVIKSAILHAEPKVLENFTSRLSDQETPLNEQDLQHNQLTIAATCAVMLEESKAKSAATVAAAMQHQQELIREAQRQSEEIIAQAKIDAEQIKLEAYEDGKNRGYAEGEAAGKTEVEARLSETITQAVQKAERIIALAEQQSKDSVLSAETKVVQLAMAIADKVIPQHFIDAPQVIFPLVKAALEKVKDQNAIVIKVSPENYGFLLMAKNELQSMLDGEDALEIASDQMLGNTDCVIESANGNVDARLETQMAIVKKAVQEVVDDGNSN